jgi:hypothetical protein
MIRGIWGASRGARTCTCEFVVVVVVVVVVVINAVRSDPVPFSLV